MTVYRVVIIILAVACVVRAAEIRTWTGANGKAVQAEFVREIGGQVALRTRAGRIVQTKRSSLSQSDRDYLDSLKISAPMPRIVAPSVGKSGSLAVLLAPFSVKATPITGKGDDRKASFKVTNNSNKSAKDFILMMYYLKADGSVGKSVPYSQSGFYNLNGHVLKKGQTYTSDVTSFFMEDDTAAMAGMVQEATFEDGSTWPVLPARPAQNGKDPVSAVVAGVMGKSDQAVPAVACFSYSAKDVKSIMYKILYLDSSGKTVDDTNYSYTSDSSIIDAGKAKIITGGDGPPKGAVSAIVKISSIKFTDDNKWKPSKISKKSQILLASQDFKVKSEQTRSLKYPFAVPPGNGIVLLKIGIEHGYDDSGDRGVTWKLIDSSGKVVKTGAAKSKKTVWAEQKAAKGTKWTLVIEDLDTKLTGKYAGNGGSVQVIAE